MTNTPWNELVAVKASDLKHGDIIAAVDNVTTQLTQPFTVIAMHLSSNKDTTFTVQGTNHGAPIDLTYSLDRVVHLATPPSTNRS